MSVEHKFAFDGYPAVKVNGVAYVRADSLEAMGYVKAVRCGECRKWGTEHCPVGDIWDDDDFCCYGEPKEAGGC